MKPHFTGGDCYSNGNGDTSTFSMQGGRQERRQANWLQPHPAELTSPVTSVVSAPRVSLSLWGIACLACGFSCLFSTRGTISVPGCGYGAARRFWRGRQSGTLLFFSLCVSRSRLVCPGEGFSITPLWADQGKQEGKVWYLQVKYRLRLQTDAQTGKQRQKRYFMIRSELARANDDEGSLICSAAFT